MLTSAHPAQHTALPAACRTELKYIQKVLNYIKMKVFEIYLREINSSSKMSSLASVWSIYLLCLSKYNVHNIYKIISFTQKFSMLQAAVSPALETLNSSSNLHLPAVVNLLWLQIRELTAVCAQSRWAITSGFIHSANLPLTAGRDPGLAATSSSSLL